MNLDKFITIIKENIEEKLGGNVTVSKNSDFRMVIFVWKKNDKTIHQEYFKRAYSYEEIEQIVDPIIIGKNFVEVYTNSKKSDESVVEEPVEEHKKKQNRKKKVKESIDLEIKTVIEPAIEKPEETG